jgi:hypothetical protein
MNIDYKQKYLKYKLKYLQLQEIYGGSDLKGKDLKYYNKIQNSDPKKLKEQQKKYEKFLKSHTNEFAYKLLNFSDTQVKLYEELRKPEKKKEKQKDGKTIELLIYKYTEPRAYDIAENNFTTDQIKKYDEYYQKFKDGTFVQVNDTDKHKYSLTMANDKFTAEQDKIFLDNQKNFFIILAYSFAKYNFTSDQIKKYGEYEKKYRFVSIIDSIVKGLTEKQIEEKEAELIKKYDEKQEREMEEEREEYEKTVARNKKYGTSDD